MFARKSSPEENVTDQSQLNRNLSGKFDQNNLPSQVPPSQGSPILFPPSQGLLQNQFSPGLGLTNQFSPPSLGPNNRFSPSQGLTNQFTPSHDLNNQFSPSQGINNQFPPSQNLNNQFPSSQDLNNQFPSSQDLNYQFLPNQDLPNQYQAGQSIPSLFLPGQTPPMLPGQAGGDGAELKKLRERAAKKREQNRKDSIVYRLKEKGEKAHLLAENKRLEEAYARVTMENKALKGQVASSQLWASACVEWHSAHGYDGLVLTKGPITKWMEKKLAEENAGGKK